MTAGSPWYVPNDHLQQQNFGQSPYYMPSGFGLSSPAPLAPLPTVPLSFPAASTMHTSALNAPNDRWNPQPVLQNVVATVSLGVSIDLRRIAQQARNIEYNPKRFGAAILRIRSPRTTALLFSSGKMVVTGAKSQDQSRAAGRKFARIVQKLGFEARFSSFKIQNIVACVNVHFTIRLEGVALMHHQFCTYEPELFPGVVYRMVKPRVVLLIFSTGKVVITGAQSELTINEAFEAIYPLLKMFEKQD
ncbi:hypothetical protein L596_006793 [Steinernema carpocapsae]|uniref:TATA-box-binding protein n=1 Tax=Steinernema carpocapsae TaxID=34508 RepID=A0A4U5P6Y7_STECR|nr:hypothetical protein L596_006793 [Steinernema carpocapsae]